MIAVFHHCVLSGDVVPIDTEFACSILHEQMAALSQSGLLAEADEFYVGLNGGEEDAQIARMFLPAKAKLIVHGPGMITEIPTLTSLRNWLPGHEGWKVLYHHAKGVSHPGHASYTIWRRRMEMAVVWGWRDCVAQLDNGLDACGCHWLTPEQFPTLVHDYPYFGGTFFFATAKFLMTLPSLPGDAWHNRFAAENWIGSGPRRPRVKDYCPGWP